MRQQTLDFYFDFMSPFSYLAVHKLPGICDRHGLVLRSHAVDLPKLKLLAGNTGPANVTLPTKIRYLTADLNRWAERYDLPMVFPKSLDTGMLNRAFFYAQDKGQETAFSQHVWQALWARGGDPADPVLLRELARTCGWDPEELMAWIASDKSIARLTEETEAAHEAGVFGVPTMRIGEQMWWGNDRLAFMEEALNRGIHKQPV